MNWRALIAPEDSRRVDTECRPQRQPRAQEHHGENAGRGTRVRVRIDRRDAVQGRSAPRGCNGRNPNAHDKAYGCESHALSDDQHGQVARRCTQRTAHTPFNTPPFHGSR